MLLQPYKSGLAMTMLKEVEAHKMHNCFTLMINSKSENKHRNKDSKFKTILSIWYFDNKRLPNRQMMKHKVRLCPHVVMQQLGKLLGNTYPGI